MLDISIDCYPTPSEEVLATMFLGVGAIHELPLLQETASQPASKDLWATQI
jgi:hypothetical protein